MTEVMTAAHGNDETRRETENGVVLRG